MWNTGVVARASFAISDSAARRSIDGSGVGRLHDVHRGVHAVGHVVLSPRGRWMAAVLAGGPGAALSHASAAALCEPRASAARKTDVTVRRTGRARPAGAPAPPAHASAGRGGPRTTASRSRRPSPRPRRHAPAPPARTTARSSGEHEAHGHPLLVALARPHAGHRGASRLLATPNVHRCGGAPLEWGHRLATSAGRHRGEPVPAPRVMRVPSA